MERDELLAFKKLKQAVEAAFRQRYPGCSKPVQEWRGQEIVDFQEDLVARVQGRISEKWFYTHMKTETHEKLPRIDMLNLLSRYAGYLDWNDFVFQNGKAGVAEHKEKESSGSKKSLRGWPLKALGLFVALILIGFGARQSFQESVIHARFCFTDAITGKAVTEKLEVFWLKPGESPQALKVSREGCVQLKTAAKEVMIVVKAPYYHPDTLVRHVAEDTHQETLPLQPDDYALMIHLFSTHNLKDWKERRAQLQEMIAEEARIFQVDPQGERGLELYNKEDFIDKLTLPINSLKNIEVLEVLYDGYDRIRLLRFTQHP